MKGSSVRESDARKSSEYKVHTSPLGGYGRKKAIEEGEYGLTLKLTRVLPLTPRGRIQMTEAWHLDCGGRKVSSAEKSIGKKRRVSGKGF